MHSDCFFTLVSLQCYTSRRKLRKQFRSRSDIKEGGKFDRQKRKDLEESLS